MVRLYTCLLLCIVLVGCATTTPTSATRLQQAQADLVVNFQSWNLISFIKPDLTGTAQALAVRPRTFTKTAVVKLLRNLKIPRGFVVVVLDTRFNPDPMVTNGGMDEIQKFFAGLGFRRIAFQDSAALDRAGGNPILRDSALP